MRQCRERPKRKEQLHWQTGTSEEHFETKSLWTPRQELHLKNSRRLGSAKPVDTAAHRVQHMATDDKVMLMKIHTHISEMLAVVVTTSEHEALMHRMLRVLELVCQDGIFELDVTSTRDPERTKQAAKTNNIEGGFDQEC